MIRVPVRNNLTSSAGITFITKSDASGNLIWAKNLGGSNASTSIAVDVLRNVYITGSFRGTADFDPGPGTYNLTSAGDEDIFVTKLDASGNFVWAKKMGGASDDDGNSIAVDASGNVYTTGYFQGTADFDPGPEHIILHLLALMIFLFQTGFIRQFCMGKKYRQSNGGF